MAGLLKRYAMSMTSLILQSQPTCNPAYYPVRSLFTSPTLLAKTRKRRKRYPFFWLQDKYKAYYEEYLTTQNEEFFQQFLKEKFSLQGGSSPLKTEPWNLDSQFTEGTHRTGVLAVKMGVVSMWSKSGKRIQTTCLRVSDNHVIKYHSPEEYSKIGRPVDRKRYQGLGCIVVGADSKDPRCFTAEYNGLFNESGVMSKRKLSRFFITHNARVEPGTPLFASHFKPGQWVDVYGKTKEIGYAGVRRRHKMKGGPDTHGTTKAHNRVGSIGRGRRECGPLKGRRMQGWEGGERRIEAGLKVWRVNTKYNLIFVSGCSIPGNNGDYVNVMDTRLGGKLNTTENPPPFPTTTVEEHLKLAEELYDDEIHQPDSPSIVFEISEEEKKAAADALRRFGKARTAQKIR